MKILRVNKVLRAFNCSIDTLSEQLGLAISSPNQKIAIGLAEELDSYNTINIRDMNSKQLETIQADIEHELQARINHARILELESELRARIWVLRDLGVNTLDIDGSSISLEPTFNYNPEQ